MVEGLPSWTWVEDWQLLSHENFVDRKLKEGFSRTDAYKEWDRLLRSSNVSKETCMRTGKMLMWIRVKGKWFLRQPYTPFLADGVPSVPPGEF